MIQNTNIDDYVGGWVVGNFTPTLFPSSEVEVACKRYFMGDTEARHYHAAATEVTIVTQGSVKMNGRTYGFGSVITIPPGESTDFEALGTVSTTVIKFPSVPGDKYQGYGPGEVSA